MILPTSLEANLWPSFYMPLTSLGRCGAVTAPMHFTATFHPFIAYTPTFQMHFLLSHSTIEEGWQKQRKGARMFYGRLEGNSSRRHIWGDDSFRSLAYQSRLLIDGRGGNHRRVRTSWTRIQQQEWKEQGDKKLG